MPTMDWTAAAKSNIFPFFAVHFNSMNSFNCLKGIFHLKKQHEKKYSYLWSNIKRIRINGQTKTKKNFSQRFLLPPLLFVAIGNQKKKKKKKENHRIDSVSIELLFFVGSKNKHIEGNWTTEGAGTVNALQTESKKFSFSNCTMWRAYYGDNCEWNENTSRV